ncbi:MAG: hypothetical protein ACLP5H_23515 [Desulfomonilaceae bacterium]
MDNNSFQISSEGIARAAKIFQQLIANEPNHKFLSRDDLIRLLDLDLFEQTQLRRYFWEHHHITYPRDQIAAVWKRAETILADMDEETETSAKTLQQSMGTTPNTSFEGRARSTTTQKSGKPKAAKGESSSACKYDPSHDPGPDYTWIPKCAYEKDGRTVKLRGHWRKRKASKAGDDTARKFDQSHRPGPNWVWSKGFETKSGYSVRGHWRATRKCWKKSLDQQTRRGELESAYGEVPENETQY